MYVFTMGLQHTRRVRSKTIGEKKNVQEFFVFNNKNGRRDHKIKILVFHFTWRALFDLSIVGFPGLPCQTHLVQMLVFDIMLQEISNQDEI